MMQKDLFQTLGYQELILSHIEKSIKFLFENNQEFALACETEYLSFEPKLPKDILNSFGETVLFVLSGYTYESAYIHGSHFSFEAGFGEENFGSLVTLPLLAIKQIFVDEYPISINISTPLTTNDESQSTDSDSQKSMEALLSNPENKKLLNKKKL